MEVEEDKRERSVNLSTLYTQYGPVILKNNNKNHPQKVNNRNAKEYLSKFNILKLPKAECGRAGYP